ncbi:MAG: PepSY-like domain-containing protein [Prevotellaceae bacterium]|jgi:hypothetical protein|nr:PepSY-like domain-containing protein [Prevotellaceae bacterium]
MKTNSRSQSAFLRKDNARSLKRNIALFLAATFFFFSSCAKEKFITEQELPEKSRTFIAAHFPQTTVSFVTYEWNDYDVLLSNGFQLSFNGKGEWQDVDGENSTVPQSIVNLIPEKISEFIKIRFPDAAITEISKEKYGWDIGLSNDVDLEFNKNGSIREVD